MPPRVVTVDRQKQASFKWLKDLVRCFKRIRMPYIQVTLISYLQREIYIGLPSGSFILLAERSIHLTGPYGQQYFLQSLFIYKEVYLICGERKHILDCPAPYRGTKELVKPASYVVQNKNRDSLHIDFIFYSGTRKNKQNMIRTNTFISRICMY